MTHSTWNLFFGIWNFQNYGKKKEILRGVGWQRNGCF